ncbi:MAG TPA: M55 family metallopeptidase, partial [Gemmatimonadaceae bacterium]|nr:M55 family metallopeptidase [Gemmatimonadaceae bacterium]
TVMPWLEFVVTKKATSASTVELRPVDAVHAEMREKAARAVRNLSKAKVMTLATPMRAGLHAVPPASLALRLQRRALHAVDGLRVWPVASAGGGGARKQDVSRRSLVALERSRV